MEPFLLENVNKLSLQWQNKMSKSNTLRAKWKKESHCLIDIIISLYAD